ncbi:hypothetical protein SCG7086_AR_00110 [Chlamydiales bacterium SCGC AG-110-P3]|nr:hypothetical protein SCG7086_AR_00110 [Chlamydiales bacterium SCGC AG-110-P3]
MIESGMNEAIFEPESTKTPLATSSKLKGSAPAGTAA